MNADARIGYLEDRLRIVAGTAWINSRHREDAPDCPGSMIAVYVDAEVAHALAGHTEPEHGVDCLECIGSRVGQRYVEQGKVSSDL